MYGSERTRSSIRWFSVFASNKQVFSSPRVVYSDREVAWRRTTENSNENVQRCVEEENNIHRTKHKLLHSRVGDFILEPFFFVFFTAFYVGCRMQWWGRYVGSSYISTLCSSFMSDIFRASNNNRRRKKKTLQWVLIMCDKHRHRLLHNVMQGTPAGKCTWQTLFG